MSGTVSDPTPVIFHPLFEVALDRAKAANEVLKRDALKKDDVPEYGKAILDRKVLELAHSVLSAYSPDDVRRKTAREKVVNEMRRAEYKLETAMSRIIGLASGYERKYFYLFAARTIDSIITNINRRGEPSVGSAVSADPSRDPKPRRTHLAGGEDCMEDMLNAITWTPVCRINRSVDFSTGADVNYYHALAKVKICDLALRFVQIPTGWDRGFVGDGIEEAERHLDSVRTRRTLSKKAFVEDPMMKLMIASIQAVADEWDPSEFVDSRSTSSAEAEGEGSVGSCEGTSAGASEVDLDDVD